MAGRKEPGRKSGATLEKWLTVEFIYQLKSVNMVIFHSDVSLPEGKTLTKLKIEDEERVFWIERSPKRKIQV